MQTFLPVPSFSESARMLDTKRLGKQRVETLQIVQALLSRRVVTSATVIGPRGGKRKIEIPYEDWRIEHTAVGWANHPATRMWAGHIDALVAYQRAVCFEWRNNRGFTDTCLDKTIFVAETVGGDGVVFPGENIAPSWLGNEAFHASHRSNLLRKDPTWYGQFGWSESPDLDYVWPTA